MTIPEDKKEQYETNSLSQDLLAQATNLVDNELIETFYASDACFLVISFKTGHLGKEEY